MSGGTYPLASLASSSAAERGALTSHGAGSNPASPTNVPGWKSRIARMLGISTTTIEPYDEGTSPAWGDRLAPVPVSVTRWHMADLEAAILEADLGQMRKAAQLCRGLRRDGTLAGLLATRTGGLVRLPKRFTGGDDMVGQLRGDARRRGIDEMFPSAELSLLVGDGILLGVGVAQLLSVQGRAHPVLRRLDPEWLVYRWHEDRWYYQSTMGLIPITPGDGRWVMYFAGGIDQPWQHGLWAALGRAFIAKDHAIMNRENYAAKLANAARVAIMPNGASEEQKQSWFRKVMAWGANTVFGLTPGYDVKLLESNGRGFEVFKDIIEKSDQEFVIALAGQSVTTDGGAGFSNADAHKSTVADLIQDNAESLAACLNEQGIRPWVNAVHGADALEEQPLVAWDAEIAPDLKAEADAAASAANALAVAKTILEGSGLRPDAASYLAKYGIRVVPAEPTNTNTDDERQAA